MLSVSCYDLKKLIYSGFLIAYYTFSTISPVRGANFNYFKNNLSTYLFETLQLILLHSQFDSKCPPYCWIYMSIISTVGDIIALVIYLFVYMYLCILLKTKCFRYIFLWMFHITVDICTAYNPIILLQQLLEQTK